MLSIQDSTGPNSSARPGWVRSARYERSAAALMLHMHSKLPVKKGAARLAADAHSYARLPQTPVSGRYQPSR